MRRVLTLQRTEALACAYRCSGLGIDGLYDIAVMSFIGAAPYDVESACAVK